MFTGAAGDIPYAYLQLMHGMGYRLRVLPIGLASNGDARWMKFRHLLVEPMSSPFVNIVCAPLGLSMGVAFSASDVGAQAMKDAEHTKDLLPQAKDSAPAYVPQTALAGLCTVGCANIAILMPLTPERAQALDRLELEKRALAQYDLIICPTAEDVEGMRYLGLGQAVFAPPDRISMQPILELLCGAAAPPSGEAIERDTTTTQQMRAPKPGFRTRVWEWLRFARSSK